jgi:hypothetical protein
MTDPDIVSTITKQSEDEKEERNSVHINQCTTLCYSILINGAFNIIFLQLQEISELP